jgi:hypothetical protein
MMESKEWRLCSHFRWRCGTSVGWQNCCISVNTRISVIIRIILLYSIRAALELHVFTFSTVLPINKSGLVVMDIASCRIKDPDERYFLFVRKAAFHNGHTCGK